jgi:hypothetical protein
LREEHGLRVFKNRALRRIFGHKRDEVTEEWSKIHNEELHDLYSSPIIIRVIKSGIMRWARQTACVGERRGAYMVLTGKFKGKIQVGRQRREWRNNMQTGFQEVG